MAFGRSIYKNPSQLRGMIRPGEITNAMLDAVAALVAPGVTTAQLDAEAERVMLEAGAKSNFKMVRGYHHTVCASVNDQVVHGIPGDRVLQPGDIVKIDAGAEFGGWNGDSARTFVIPDSARPELVAEREELSRVTEGSMWAGVAALATARHIDDVGSAVEAYILARPSSVTGKPFGILREYIGHGIGRKMHESPSVFNYHVPDRGPEVRPGLCIAIEPMTTAGSEDTYVEDDDWTVTSVDGSAGSHWEHSVAVHADGIWVLTAADGGAAGLEPFGVTPTPIAEER